MSAKRIAMITPEEYRAHVFGFNVIGCVVRSKDVFCFVLHEELSDVDPDEAEIEGEGEEEDEYGRVDEDPGPKKRFVPFIMNRPEGRRWSSATFIGYDGLMVGFSPDPDRPHVVSAGVSGVAYVSGSGESYREQIRLSGGPKRGGFVKLKTIGTHLYVCGNARSVDRRDGRDLWHDFSTQIPYVDGPSLEGFEDIDGFAENDIYAAGGSGDVWHYDGEQWRRCAFPSDLLLSSLCCAPDGFVYIGGLHGHVYKGRGDHWMLIHEGHLSLPFRDMVWYDNRIWCTNDYGIWTIEDGRVEGATVATDVRVCAGYLSARDGTLLVAGYGGAAYCQDGQWRTIFHSLDMNMAMQPSESG